MSSIFSRYATPFTTGLFLVSLVSGIALFFHFGTTAFREMHEWLSMVLILPFVLHVWKNWRPFLAYFKRLPMALSLAICLAAGLVFAWPALTGSANTSVNPQVAMIELVLSGSTAEIAALYDISEESLKAKLADQGFKSPAADATMADMATSSGKTERDIVSFLASLRN